MSNRSEVRKRIFEILDKSKSGDIYSRLFGLFLVSLITTNMIAVVLESFSSIKYKYEYAFKIFETVSVIIFTIEYLLRIWTADFKYPGESRLKAIVRYICSGMAIVDLLAILPFYIPFAVRIDLRIIRMLRLTRILRILKIGRYSESLSLIARVFKKKKSDLLVTVFVTSLLLLLSSSLMYYIESGEQPEKFPNIIASSWWAVATLTTVGYGDVYPITVFGKILSGIIAMLGIGLVALPTGIISSGFMEEIHNQDMLITEKKGENNFCPNCGHKLHD